MGARLASLSGVTGATQGRGLSFITSTTFSAASTVSIDNCFTTTYDNYRITLDITASASILIAMRMRASAADDSTSNYTNQRLNAASATITGQQITAQTSANIFAAYTGRASGFLDINGAALARATSGMAFNQYGLAGTAIWESNGFQHNVASAFDGFSLITSSGTMTGSLSVFAYRSA